MSGLGLEHAVRHSTGEGGERADRIGAAPRWYGRQHVGRSPRSWPATPLRKTGGVQGRRTGAGGHTESGLGSGQ